MKILIADDNEAVRQLLCVALHGHEVVVAEDGAEAIALAECRLPDIILMDVMMPEVDGFIALEALKAHENTADIPVVLMSAGCVRRYDVRRGLALGAIDYLKKPFGIVGLGKLLEGYIEKAKKKSGA